MEERDGVCAMLWTKANPSTMGCGNHGFPLVAGKRIVDGIVHGLAESHLHNRHGNVDVSRVVQARES
jgi:hypothetical protein